MVTVVGQIAVTDINDGANGTNGTNGTNGANGIDGLPAISTRLTYDDSTNKWINHT